MKYVSMEERIGLLIPLYLLCSVLGWENNTSNYLTNDEKGIKTLNTNQSSMKKNDCVGNIDLTINMLFISFIRTIWKHGRG